MNHRQIAASALAALALTACTVTGATRNEPAQAAAASPSGSAAMALNQLARDYVALSLEIGTHEDGYIDAYYGPPDIRTAAETVPRDKPALRRAISALRDKLVGLDRVMTGMDQRRIAFLDAQLTAADTRLQMMSGTRFAFAEEAARLFGVRPVIKPLAAYDAGLADIAALLPGDGPLAARVDAYLDRFVIPKDKLLGVFDAAIAACRARTAPHIAMPAGERFTLEFVTDKPWSGYNYYKGDYKSLIQINTDLPIRLSRASIWAVTRGIRATTRSISCWRSG